MPAIDRKDMPTDKFSALKMRLIRHVRHMPGATFLYASFLGLALLLTASFGCAPPSTGNSEQNDSAVSAPNDSPEITDEKLRQKINDVYVREVPEETGAGETISWRFDEDEPKEFTVVEKKMDGNRATIVLDIKTGTAPNARSPKYLAGRIRTKWELRTGWAMRTWEIAETDNISMKYKNLPKPSAQNSNP